MRSYLHRTYIIFWIVIMILFVFLFACTGVDITKRETKGNYEILTEYEMIVQPDSTAPTGLRRLYTFSLDGVDNSYCDFVFYCVHQNAKVYLENACIYSMQAENNKAMGKSAGYVWNHISFDEQDNGKTVTLEITPVYSSSNDIIPILYLGNRYDIARDIIMAGLPNFLFSLIMVIMGLIYIIFVVYNNRKTTVESNLSMLGIVSIQLGLWRIAESEMLNLLFPGKPALAQFTFLMLMLACVSMLLYIKALYSTNKHFIWKIPCVLSIANILVAITLQCFGVVDLRQMLPCTHIIMGVIAIVTVIMTIYEIATIGLHKKLKLNIACIGICFAGEGIDMLIYYVSHGSAPSIFGMASFLCFILVLGINSMKEIKELMQAGIKAQEYEQLAYHDQLTGLYNRTAYEAYINSDEFQLENCIVVVMDLNHLKRCNDELGHDKGDIYIRESARMIMEMFGEEGCCYRMGGDEFYVLLENGNSDLCKHRIRQLQKMVSECEAIGDFKMGIACGYKRYDSSRDLNIDETIRRADKAMYKDKSAGA